MFVFLFSDSNFWFSAAIGIVFALFILETIGMLLGLSLLSFLDDVLPSQINIDTSASGGFSSVLSWLCLDRLPLMIWLMILLSSFGLTGYLLNFSAMNLLSIEFSSKISIPISLIVALIITGRLGKVIARLVPKTESTATHEHEFEGNVAHITVGTATSGSPAEAKCIDQFKQVHYLMVEPLEAEERFEQNDKIILVKKGTRSWLATRYM